MDDPNERSRWTVWEWLEQAREHLADPPPGGWDRPEDVEGVRGVLRSDPAQAHAFDGEGTPLHKAADWCLPAIAEVLLQFGADVNARPEGAWTPLHQAVARSQDEEPDLRLVRVLLDHGADPHLPDAGGQTPLDLAWGRTAELLRERGAGLDLNQACRLGLVDRVRQVLESDPEAVLEAPRPERLLSDALASCAGSQALEAQAVELLTLLLRHGAGVNAVDSDGGTALLYACNGGPTSAVRLLLLHGAAPNVRSAGGETPLSLARRSNRPDVVDLLLRSGARE